MQRFLSSSTNCRSGCFCCSSLRARTHAHARTHTHNACYLTNANNLDVTRRTPRSQSKTSTCRRTQVARRVNEKKGMGGGRWLRWGKRERNLPTLVQSALRNTQMTGVLPNPSAIPAHGQVNVLRARKKGWGTIEKKKINKMQKGSKVSWRSPPLLFSLRSSSSLTLSRCVLPLGGSSTITRLCAARLIASACSCLCASDSARASACG